MNASLLDGIADAIEGDPTQYDQRAVGNPTDCNSPCCVGGWAIRLAAPPDSRHESGAFLDTAARLLGLNHRQRDALLSMTVPKEELRLAFPQLAGFDFGPPGKWDRLWQYETARNTPRAARQASRMTRLLRHLATKHREHQARLMSL